MSLWLIIPVKELRLAKSRLAMALSPAHRATLVQTLLLRLLRLAEQTAAIDHALVVSRDEAVLHLARLAGHKAVAEERVVGLNGAVQWGVKTAAEQGATRALILPADLPILEQADVDALLAATADFVICTDRQNEGTNALLLPTAVPFVFQYGPASFQKHQAEAKRHNLSMAIITSPHIQFDLDTEADWLAYQRHLVRA